MLDLWQAGLMKIVFDEMFERDAARTIKTVRTAAIVRARSHRAFSLLLAQWQPSTAQHDGLHALSARTTSTERLKYRICSARRWSKTPVSWLEEKLFTIMGTVLKRLQKRLMASIDGRPIICSEDLQGLLCSQSLLPSFASAMKQMSRARSGICEFYVEEEKAITLVSGEIQNVSGVGKIT